MLSPEEQEKLLKIRKLQLKAELERRQKEIADYLEHESRAKIILNRGSKCLTPTT